MIDPFEKEPRDLHDETDRIARMVMIQQRIVDTLDTNNAFHLWVPDDQGFLDNIAALTVDRYMQDDRSSRAEVAESVTYRGRIEVHIVKEIMKSIVVNEGAQTSIKTTPKKRLQITARLAKFDDGWVAAINELVPGESLELQRKSDMELYLHSTLPIDPPQSY